MERVSKVPKSPHSSHKSHLTLWALALCHPGSTYGYGRQTQQNPENECYWLVGEPHVWCGSIVGLWLHSANLSEPNPGRSDLGWHVSERYNGQSHV